MSESDDVRTILAVAELGRRVHVVLDGRTMCGRAVSELDLYHPRVGLEGWAVGRQCGSCLRRLRGSRLKAAA